MKKLVMFTVLLAVVACKKGTQEISIESGAERSALFTRASNFFQSVSSLPYEDIPENKIELGKKLYFDTRLSKDGNISCNSCHNLETFGVDNLPLSPGDTKELGGRNSPTVFYSSLHHMQFWDGRAKDVEEQAGGPILNPVEHNIPSEAYLEDKLRKIDEYQKLFKTVFPGQDNPITFANITDAIGAFERMLNPPSRFDNYLDGDEDALTVQEKQGLEAFIDNGCITCHMGVALGGQMLQKFGLYDDYWIHTKSQNVDHGLYDLTKNEADKFMFKVPSLRNIEKTAPYFHDGSIESLTEAVSIMGKLQTNKEFTDKELTDIVVFLKTLTSDIDDKYKRP